MDPPPPPPPPHRNNNVLPLAWNCRISGVACKDIAEIAALCKEKGWWLIEDRFRGFRVHQGITEITNPKP